MMASRFRESKAFLLALVLALLLLLAPNHLEAQVSARDAPDPNNSRRWVEQTLQQLSVEERVGQMLQVRIYGDYRDFDDPAYRFVAEQIQRYHIGSVDLAGRMSGPNLVKGSPAQVAAITNQLQRVSRLPLLVGADIERGLASRLSDVPDFPFPMAFGATDDAKMVEEFGAITAREARAVGIQWAFAPVADVNSNPANPIINTRSFGEDPQQVGNLVAVYIRGAHRNGVFVAVKHFPGHGDSSIDSHVGIVRVSGDRQHLDKYELPPFKMAIEAGAVRAPLIQQVSTTFNEQLATGSTSISWRQQDSTNFNKGLNLIRDQVVGRSNSFFRPFSLLVPTGGSRSPYPAHAGFATASDTASCSPCQSDRATAARFADSTPAHRDHVANVALNLWSQKFTSWRGYICNH
jgi:Glycosyl hydrolase family 3 N terminal domain